MSFFIPPFVDLTVHREIGFSDFQALPGRRKRTIRQIHSAAVTIGSDLAFVPASNFAAENGCPDSPGIKTDIAYSILDKSVQNATGVPEKGADYVI